MATSSRQSSIFGINDWKAIYQTFSQADLQSYDYETLRKSFIDYLRANYPETFNDYTESSEFVALLDVMAFMGQALSFRSDLNARENFIDTAERRDSVIKLANLVGYNPKRNIAGQGFLKVTSVKTTEQVKDINGLFLNNLTILWNDPSNPNWQEQFNSILNATLVNSQRVGRPGHSNTILGIKTDEYSVNLTTTTLPAFKFSASINGTNTDFEVVSTTSLNEEYIYENPPAPNGIFNMLYRNDNLGYGSPNTGFFLYFKQGTLQSYDFNITQRVSNQVVDIPIQYVNDSDTWLYQIDAVTGALTKWSQVDSVYSNTYLQTGSNDKTLFSVVSGFNDQVSYSFGDGVFSKIPTGMFRAFIRSGNAMEYSIDPTEMQGINIDIPYVSRTNRVETLTLTLELQLPVNNAQTRESLASIKERAPTRYYTQNRMVNGEDYNNFPYTLYNSIIKSKALNRSSVGVSRNLDLLDPTAKYSSTNNFADDGGLYIDTNDGYINFSFASTNDIASFFSQNLAKVLQGHRVLQYYVQNYKRYDLKETLGVGSYTNVLWHQTSLSALEATGYFRTVNGSIPLGSFSSSTSRYITPGAMIKFTAPAGYYFDDRNRLVAGLITQSSKTYIWATVIGVVADGYNNGLGNLSSGKGPVSLNISVPEGAIASVVIPAFSNTIPNSVIQDCIVKAVANQSFSLSFNNSLLATQTRWSVTGYPITDYVVNFQCVGVDRYLVTYKSIAYYFGSVRELRFTFDSDKIVYDPLSGKLLQDHINVLKTNNQPNSSTSLLGDTILNVVGMYVEADGYVDDYSVEVSSRDANNKVVLTDPDFFSRITGYNFNGSNTSSFVFFKKTLDANMLTRYDMASYGEVVYAYTTKTAIENVKYEFKIGQVFYTYPDDKFYIINESATVQNFVTVDEITSYRAGYGRQGLHFQYKHTSPNTTRIDPATSNIIDLYVVTQSYYTQYQSWVQDTTGAISEPTIPSINELRQSYGKIDDYKMLTDSVIMNSVRFKPLFGSKADPALRATIKVIKSSTTTASDSEIRSAVLSEMNKYFTIDKWNFGDTFYFSELSAYLHSTIGDLVNSVVLVPNDPSLKFGELYEIRSAPYEIFVNAAQATDITVISALTPAELQISK